MWLSIERMFKKSKKILIKKIYNECLKLLKQVELDNVEKIIIHFHMNYLVVTSKF